MLDVDFVNKKSITFEQRTELGVRIIRSLLSREDSEQKIREALWHSNESLHEINEDRFMYLLGEALEELGIEDEENETLDCSIIDSCKGKDVFTDEQFGVIKKLPIDIAVDLYIFRGYGDLIILQ